VGPHLGNEGFTFEALLAVFVRGEQPQVDAVFAAAGDAHHVAVAEEHFAAFQRGRLLHRDAPAALAGALGLTHMREGEIAHA